MLKKLNIYNKFLTKFNQEAMSIVKKINFVM